MKIVTGATGQAHVTAADDGSLQAALFGSGEYVLPIGEQFAYEIMSANRIRIKSGDLMVHGRFARIPHGFYDEIAIENGTSGYNRNDLIVCRYEEESGVESMTLEVVKGTPTTGTASDPILTTGNIITGDVLHEMPLYRVRLEGVNLVAVEPLFSVVDMAISQKKDQLCHSTYGEMGVSGYAIVAKLTVTKTYVDRPIHIRVLTRHHMETEAVIRFDSAGNIDPALSIYKTQYGNIPVYLHKVDVATWHLLVKKSEAYDMVYVNNYVNNNAGVTITWMTGILTELPTENLYTLKKEPASISDGGTGATTAAAALTALGATSIKLLWTNASPSSSFAAQSVNVNLSGCTFALVVYRNSTSSSAYTSDIVRVGNAKRVYIFASPATAGTYLWLNTRNVTLTTTKATFEAGTEKRAIDTAYNDDNTLCIPYQIYGFNIN